MKVCLKIITVLICMVYAPYIYAVDSLNEENVRFTTTIYSEESKNKDSVVDSESVSKQRNILHEETSISKEDDDFINEESNAIMQAYIKNDVIGYFGSPYIKSLTGMVGSDYLQLFALPFYGNMNFYGDHFAAPIQKYSTGITRFKMKSMSIFDKQDDYSQFVDSLSNIILNSLLGFATNNYFALNIYTSTKAEYTAGFEAMVKPFSNMIVGYSYIKEFNMEKNIFEFKYEYSNTSNISFKNMHTHPDSKGKKAIDSVFGVEWQFYF